MAVTGTQGATSPIGAFNAKTTNPGDLTVQGARLWTDVATARRKPPFIGEMKILTNLAPFLTFTESMGSGRSKSVGQTPAFHFERDRIPSTVTLDDGTGGLGSGSGYDSSDTTMTVLAGTGANVVVGMNLKYVPTGEVLHVSVRSGDNITVIRGYTSGTNGVAGAAIPASAELQILSSNFGDNSAAPNGRSVEPLQVFHRLQIVRTSIEAGGRDINSDVFGTDELERLMQDGLDSHQLNLEKTMLFNQGWKDTNTGTTDGTMTDGMFNRVVTNAFNIGGTLDEVTMESMMIAWKRYNQGDISKLVAWMGENTGRALDGFARDGVRYTPDSKILGVDVRGWRCSFGTFTLKLHPLFSPLGSSETAANGGYVGSFLMCNMANVGKLTWKNRGLRIEKDVQVPGTDGKKHCWTEDVGLTVWNERSHAKATNITG